MTEQEFKQLEALAAEGNKDAQFRLAVAYTYGDGVKDDNDKAFELYTLAAKQGHIEAQYNLGICYHYGYGTKPNAEAAFKCYFSAAEQGFAMGLVLTGLF